MTQLARQLHAIDPTLLTSSILDGAEGALGPPGSPHEDGSASSAYRPTSRMLESPMACHLGPGLITTMMTSNQRDAFYAKQRQLRAMNIAHMGLQNQVDVDVLALHVPRLGTPGMGWCMVIVFVQYIHSSVWAQAARWATNTRRLHTARRTTPPRRMRNR